MDLTESIAPKSDQINADDLMSGPRTFTIESVSKGSPEQPVDVHLVEFPGRPFRPSKSMRRVLVAAWGVEAAGYTGRKLTLYRDPDITFGRDKVGGIRISHLSHIDKPLTLALTVTRGKRSPFVVNVLEDEPVASAELLADLGAMFTRKGIPTDAQLAGANHVTGGTATSLEQLTEADVRKVLNRLATRPDVEPS